MSSSKKKAKRHSLVCDILIIIHYAQRETMLINEDIQITTGIYVEH